MGPIRQIIDDAPDAIPVPKELRHRRIEFILWPLDEPAGAVETEDYERTTVDQIVIPPREERHARR